MISSGLASNKFYAYYTKLPSNFEILEDYQDQLFGRYSDLVIQFRDQGKVIFSRNSSYLPVWQYGHQTWQFEEVVVRHGDGPEFRPDILSKYSHVRLISQSTDTIIVHWRYYPDADYVEWDGVVDEYFYFTPDLKVTRTIQKGTALIDDWITKRGLITQILQLSGDGIITLSRLVDSGQLNENPALVETFATDLSKAHPIIWFSLDGKRSANIRFAPEKISGKSYPVKGNKALWKKGVVDNALQFDGYYTGISVLSSLAESDFTEFSVQGWVTLAAYPFDWAPLVHQSEWNKKGFYLGIDEEGYPGFHVANGGWWISIVDSNRLELFRWYHITGIFNQNTHEISLFINGKKVVSIKNEIQPVTPAETPLIIGLNHEKMPAIKGRIQRGKWPSLFGIDGLIDEVKVYNYALSENEIYTEFKDKRRAESIIKDKIVEKRKLPVNPNNKSVSSFGAEYKTLKYYETWDNLWRVSNHADVLINFDMLPVNLVFWRGTSYGPYYVTENGKWVGDQSNEDYREFQHPGEAEGCLEHMSDKQCRHSHVRVVENNDARVLIHWRYGLVDSRYMFSPRNDGWGSWSDEYWTIYPDGVAIRYLARGKVFGDGWVETIFLSVPGTRPEDNTDLDAITILDIEGLETTLSWAEDSPKGVFENVSITQVNTKLRYKMYPTGSSVEVFGGHSRYSHFHWWNHWPVSQIISDGRGARASDRLAHSSLVWGAPAGDFLLYGITDKKPSQLIKLAKSWNHAPELKDTNGFQLSEFIQEERAYHIHAESSKISFRIDASSEFPVVNPAFVIKNWDGGIINLKINGKDVRRGKQFRYGTEYDTSGRKYVVVWLEMHREDVVKLELGIGNLEFEIWNWNKYSLDLQVSS
jgi:hypothetical protein